MMVLVYVYDGFGLKVRKSIFFLSLKIVPTYNFFIFLKILSIFKDTRTGNSKLVSLLNY